MTMLAGLTQNWLLKLLSLVFAVVLWFFVMGEQKLEVGYAVPLELQNIPKGLMIANEVPSLVDVRISGPRTVLMNLKPSDISLSVDLGDLEPGVTSFKRLEERLNLPNVLKVTRLSPSFVDVKLERIKDKTVPVQVLFSGSLPPGLRVSGAVPKPAKVTVTGAEGELKDVGEVPTEPVDLSDVQQSFTLMVPLNYRGKYTSIKGDGSVEVRVTVVAMPSRGAERPSPKGQK